MSDTQAIAARLTAIAERLDFAKRDKLHRYGASGTPVDMHNDMAFLLAHVETLTQQVAELEVYNERVDRLFEEAQALTTKVLTDNVKLIVERDAAHAALTKYGCHTHGRGSSRRGWIVSTSDEHAHHSSTPGNTSGAMESSGKDASRAGDGARPLMADTLSEKLREIIEDNPNMFGGADINEAAAELDRREAVVAAAEKRIELLCEAHEALHVAMQQIADHDGERFHCVDGGVFIAQKTPQEIAAAALKG